MLNDKKLVQLLKTLSSKEMRQLRFMVETAFFNTNPRVSKLYKLLVSSYPNFTKPLLKTSIYSQLFETENLAKNATLDKKQDKQLRDIMNYLVEIVQQLFLYNDGVANPINAKHRLAHILMERGLNDYVPATLKSAEDRHKKQKPGQIEYLQNTYLLSEADLNQQFIENGRSTDLGLQHTIDTFHHYYIAEQLRYYCAATNRENILPVHYQYPMIDEILSHIEEQDYSDIPLIEVYYRILLILKEKDEGKYFEQLKEILKQKNEYFPISELKIIYAFILNFCNRQINKGRKKYAREKLNIYKENLPMGLWHTGKIISPHQFILIVKESLAADEIDWTEKFITDYEAELPPAWKNSISNLSKAYLFFDKKAFSEAHDYLLKINAAEDFFYEIYRRTLSIQIFYEQGREYQGLLEDRLEALRVFLRPGKKKARMSEHNREICKNYLNLVRRICRIKFSLKKTNPERLDNLKQDILNTDLLIGRNWLVQKVEELREI